MTLGHEKLDVYRLSIGYQIIYGDERRDPDFDFDTDFDEDGKEP